MRTNFAVYVLVLSSITSLGQQFWSVKRSMFNTVDNNWGSVRADNMLTILGAPWRFDKHYIVKPKFKSKIQI